MMMKAKYNKDNKYLKIRNLPNLLKLNTQEEKISVKFAITF